MKKYLLILFILSTGTSFAQWRTCYQGTNVNNRVTGVSFYTPTTGYVSTIDWVGFTTDSGKTVNKKFVNISNVNYNGYPVNLTFGFTIEGVNAFSADTLLVYGDYAFEPAILYSTNGGANWKVVYHSEIRIGSATLANAIHDMIFPSKGNIGIAVQNDEIIRTTDRGATWNTTNILNDRDLFRFSFADGTRGYVAGAYSVFKTIDGGVTWNQTANTQYNISGISAVTPTNLFLSADGDTYYSSNGGNSFAKTNTASGNLNTNDIHFSNDSTGYATAQAYAIFQTRNSGKTWELMPGSNTYSYLGYGYDRMFFYNNNLAWVCGQNEYLSITGNGGGISFPKAAFESDIANTCTTGTVLLTNRSHSGYGYRWLRNGTQFATTYNASYTVTVSTDTISLITIKGAYSDTAQEIITASAATGLTVSSSPVKDTVCSNGLAYFNVYNSLPGVQYQVGRNCCGYGGAIYGNGGTIQVSTFINGNEDTLSTFTINAYRNGDCGVQTASARHTIRLLNSFPVVSALPDTVCTQKPFNITVPNSIAGYLYWTDSAFPKVSGTGGAIQLPTRDIVASYTYHVDFYDIIIRYQFGINVKHSFGCGSTYPLTIVNIVGRNTKANFTTNSHEMLTSAAFSFTDNSAEANNYRWTFGIGGSVSSSSAREPVGISYSQPGIWLIQQKTTTKEGCVDSAIRYVEVYGGSNVPALASCTGTPSSPGTDSIRKGNYFVSRTLYEDEKGDHVIAGGYTDMRFSFYPRGYEGCFAAKYSKTGSLLWYFQTTTGDDFFTYNRNSHIIFEQAVGDKSGNTYLLGHSLNRSSITDSLNIFPLQQATGFLLKMSPAGKVLWVKNLYNKDITGSNVSMDYAGGSLLRGKNDDIYVVTHRYGTSALYNFMSGNDVISTHPDNKTGIILHYDGNGNVLRKKEFPIQYNNLRRYNIYTSDSYDRLPPATWDSSGKLVIYGQLNPSEMTGNSIDGFTVPFNIAKIKSALLFVDTTTLSVVNVKPLFNPAIAGNVGINPDSYVVDAAGNYYAGYTGYIAFPSSDMAHRVDSTKSKSYIIAYNTNSSFRWKKQLEGLQPLAMLAYANDLKVYGTNYINSGFYTGNLLSDPNSSPTTHDIKKLTIVTDSADYHGQGTVGLGSLDNVVASLSTSNGNMIGMISLGTNKEEETGTMRRGYGEQFWATGTVGLSIRGVNITDTASTLMTYKLPVTNNCNLLPIVLAYFKSTCTGSSVRFDWQTLVELNANKFFIQKSNDSRNWETIATLPAKGNSVTKQDYQWTNANPQYGNSYYRLAEVDKDGYTSYSPVIQAGCVMPSTFALQIYPNPSKYWVKAKITSPVNANGMYRLYNQAGQLMLTNNLSLLKGTNIEDIDITKLPAGIYRFIMEIKGNGNLSQKIIKQ